MREVSKLLFVFIFTAAAGVAAEDAPADPAVAKGAELYQKHICSACHSLDGTARAAPSFAGLFGSKEKLKDGTEVTVDEAYIRESILNPGAKITAGFLPTMPPYKGRISDEEIDALIAFIKSVKAASPAPPAK